jgi:hypothetical protein
LFRVCFSLTPSNKNYGKALAIPFKKNIWDSGITSFFQSSGLGTSTIIPPVYSLKKQFHLCKSKKMNTQQWSNKQ